MESVAQLIRFAIHAEQTKPHQVKAAQSFLAGVNRHGHVGSIGSSSIRADGDIVVGWGLKSERLAYNRPWICLEAGYINGDSGSYIENRLRFISVNFGGTGNKCAKAYDCPPDRAVKHGLNPRDWKIGRGRVVFFGQIPTDSSVSHLDYSKDLAENVRAAHDIFGDALEFRPHPLNPCSFDYVKTDRLPLDVSLDKAAGTIAFNSTASVDAVFRGVPSITLDDRSAAWDVTTHKIGEFGLLNRYPWVYNLSYMQWTLDEIADGSCWDHLSKIYGEIYG